jgi:hypothetical protein
MWGLKVFTRCQWLIPVILATWETETVKSEASLGKYFTRPNPQNKYSKMYRMCVSRGRGPALQVQSSEFKSHSHKKKSTQKRTGSEAQVVFFLVSTDPRFKTLVLPLKDIQRNVD